MIKLFRSYNPLNMLWLAVILILLRVTFLSAIPAKENFPFAELFSRLHLHN